MALASKNGPVDFIDLKTGSVLRRSRLYVSMAAKLVPSADDRSLAILGMDNFLQRINDYPRDGSGSDPMNSLNGGCTASDLASGCVLRSEPARLINAEVSLPSLRASPPNGIIGILTTDLQTDKQSRLRVRSDLYRRTIRRGKKVSAA